MEKQTVFVRRYPSKGELPKKDGRYITSKGLSTMYKLNEGCGKRTGYGFWQSLKIEWWLEEIELPSYGDVYSESFKSDKTPSDFIKGANYILNKLKGE